MVSCRSLQRFPTTLPRWVRDATEVLKNSMISDDAVRALLPLSEQVIEQIEQRIITQQDGGRGSVTLSRPCTRFAACSKTSTAGVVITAAFELGSSWNLEGLAPRQLVRYLSRNYVCPCYPRI